ncbi:MAG TPA: succinylglutamate-semialdehyde dehydrogenase [Rickettsiales bacterium]|nr:succinylglutamate-semialdehyde dehydrogenase [Rickettsiales bacterium]
MSYSGKLYINGQWKAGSGKSFQSFNPATGKVIWEGNSANKGEVDAAVDAARNAFHEWGFISVDERVKVARKFQEIVMKRKQELSDVLAQETGKMLWDATAEIASMASKLDVALQAYNERTGERFSDASGFKTALRHKPYGVVAVFGPYNYPAHLPNGHIVPALIAGNTVVFKPSELAPLVAEKMMECWEQAGLPAGVVNLVQGERDTGKALSSNPGLDGLFFTGSTATGKILNQQFADAPHKILALELGGNNPLVVHEVEDKQAAAYWTIQSAYITTGQRCTCARRLIVPLGAENDKFIYALVKMTQTIRVGAYDAKPEPFMGPLISDTEAKRLLDAQEQLIRLGGKPLVQMKRLHETLPFVSPGLIDVTDVKDRPDTEWFGPLLQVIRVPDLKAAVEVANNTAYGLSSAIFSDKREHYDYFLKHIRAGIVNWNRPSAGSSANLPFGGRGLSGNNRPTAYYAADYCAYPVASNEATKSVIPPQPAPGIQLS